MNKDEKKTRTYEMIKDMCPDYGTMCQKCNSYGSCSVEYTAKMLVDKNYHKIADDEIIILPSEYDTITEFYERWKEADRQLYTARHETAREIVEDLLPYQGHYPVYVLIRKLTRKYGIE